MLKVLHACSIPSPTRPPSKPVVLLGRTSRDKSGRRLRPNRHGEHPHLPLRARYHPAIWWPSTRPRIASTLLSWHPCQPS